MSPKMCRVSNRERRPVIFRGRSGESFHLAAMESGREVRALELESNPMVEKLKKRNVISVEEVVAVSRAKKKAKPKKMVKSNQRVKSNKPRASIPKNRPRKSGSSGAG